MTKSFCGLIIGRICYINHVTTLFLKKLLILNFILILNINMFFYL